ncbi:MAG: hypothetical protein J5923_03405, partial [Acidaminococcaceae bacterium]|nr:hypothetical protein [Acidaminococcaceae bacterium]
TTTADVKANDNVKLTSTAGAITTNGTVTAETGNVEATAQGDVTTNANLSAEQGAITLTSDAENVAVKAEAIAKDDITLKAEAGSVAIDGTVTSTEGNVIATAKNTVTTTADVKANDNVKLTSTEGTITTDGAVTAENNVNMEAKGKVETNGAVKAGSNVSLLSTEGAITTNDTVTAETGNINATANGTVTTNANLSAAQGAITLTSENADIKQSATAGIQAQTVTAVSAKSVDLQGTGNQFETITVQSSTENAPIQGSVLVQDSADNLDLSIESAVNGDIAVENNKSQGTLHAITELLANGNGADAKGDIALKSDGSLQTNREITAANDVKLTSARGDVSINGDISTGTAMPDELDIENLQDAAYNSLAIHAGGAIQEAAGVKIETPVVETYSGKGVCMESGNNAFGVFLADALPGSTVIDGSVKVVSHVGDEEQDNDLMVGVGASIKGDAEFTNVNQNGDIGILIWNPDDENREIKVLGGNGSEGNLVLTASQDVSLLGDANAAHDIVVDSTNGSFYGIGRGMTAGHDVSVAAGDAVYYIGTITAGNDIDIQAQNANSTEEDRGIYVGALPENFDPENGVAPACVSTTLTAGNQASFEVKGNGNIGLEGYVTAGTGDVVANISGEGSVVITKSVESENANVSVTTGKGDIYIGTDNAEDDKTVTAKKNVNVETGLGTVYILGMTSTTDGDITMTAGQNEYKEGTDSGNFIIRDDGKLNSGGGITLNGRNGDIEITDDIQAKKGITVNIAEQGNAAFGRDVSVTNDVNISTDKGNITVGHTVNSDEGMVNLQTGKGDILVGKDITAGQDVSISAHDGNVVVGDTATGDDGDVLSRTGNVSIHTDSGNVGIVKTVTAQEGSIDIAITSGEGSILIGNNGPTDLTVHAKQNIELTTQDGVIEVYGKTKTDKGDITVVARDKESDSNLFIKNDGITFNGELDAASDSVDPDATGNLSLQTYNGDIEITDHTKAKGNINAKVENKGNITFGVDVNTDGDLSFAVGEGNIIVGKDVKAAGDIAMTSGTGNIIVGSTVTSEEGNVDIQTNEGLVAIQKAVSATAGSIGIQVGTGGVTIGNNGPGVETVTAYKNIDIGVELGQIEIYGKTSTKTGDISMSAAENQYTPGAQNIIIAQNGEVDSAQDVRLTGRNGDLRVTDAVKATRNLEVQVLDEGDISLDRDVNVNGDTTVSINGPGSINGHNIVSGGTTHVALTNGDLFLNLAEGRAVVLRMENNTAASRVNTVLADASGGAGPDVELTGNFIQIGTVRAKGGNSVLQLSAMGAGNQKLISGNFSVNHLSSANGTHMPNLWANTGFVYVDEGHLAIDDVLAVDKIRLENAQTTLAIYGRTPTRDGEQLVYWNNLDWANSKQRSFQLYTNGKVRTRGAVLIDAGRNYGKLYGDNLSVVDMMRERVTHEHGQYTFDRTWFTKPGEALREKMLFGMDTVDTGIRRHNASDEDLR